MCAAAVWLGRFHKEFVPRSSQAHTQRSLHAHDGPYYDGWLRHAQAFVDAIDGDAPWSAAIVTRRREILCYLLAAERTVVHGDFYSKNILSTSSCVYPVDWESAATGAGEVDLATLVQGWSDEIAAACVDAYCAARWGANPPVTFAAAFAAAQVYAMTRTTSFEGWTRTTRGQQRALRQIHTALQQLGVV
jgi:thiamine kinase-like enzyme